MPLFVPPLPLAGGTLAGPVSNTSLNTWDLDSFTGTDDQKMTSALAAVFAAGGGTILLAARAHTFANQWSTSYSAGVVTRLRIRGAGSGFNGNLQGSVQGAAVTSVTFTYSGAGPGCAVFEHLGSVEVSDIQFCSANAGVPFIFVTNPAPSIHACAFNGGGTGTSCVTDAIVLGGTVAAGTGFQGYGAWIRDNFLDGVRYWVTFGAYANAVRVDHNTGGVTCGNAANFGAPFLLKGDGTSGGGPCGNQISRNLVEMVHYQAVAYAPAGAYACNNQIGPNTTWDASFYPAFVAADSTSTGTMVDETAYGASSQQPYDPSLSSTRLSIEDFSNFRQNVTFYGTPVARNSGSTSAFLSEGNTGGRVGLCPVGTSITGFPTGAQVVAWLPKQATDGYCLSGAPYAYSPSLAAFTLADVGAYCQSVAVSGIPAATRIVWAFTPTSKGIAWQASTAYALGQPVLPVTQNGHLYWASTAGTSGSTQPTWPTNGGTVTDGTVVWTDLGTTATLVQLSANCTATVSGTLPISFGRNGTTAQSMTEFLNHHILGSGSAPTWTATGAGSGYTATATGKDLGQILTLVTGTGSGAGIVLSGTANNTLYNVSGSLALTAANAAASLLMVAAAGAPYIVINGTTGWTLTIPGTPADNTTYKFHILTLG